MSAFVVNDTHIHALLTYDLYVMTYRPLHVQLNLLPGGKGEGYKSMFLGDDTLINQVGQSLADQNHRSYAKRYQNKNLNMQEACRYYFKAYPRILGPVEAIKACQCYIYQACQTPDWLDTLAYEISDHILQKAITDLEGYEHAAWHVEF